MRKRQVVVFWTDKDTRTWIGSELLAGRLRQGWGLPNTQLMEDGIPVPFHRWSEQFARSGKQAWNWDPPEKSMRTRYGILSRMLNLRTGDIVIVPRIPDEGKFTIAQVTEGYQWNDRHFHSSLPGTHPYLDFGHVVHVDPTRLVTRTYNSTPEASSIADNFRNYRSAVNNINNEHYADAIREMFDQAVSSASP